MLDRIDSDLLKEKLNQIKADNYAIHDSENILPIAFSMMQYIGCVDPELRDELIYSTFLKWTVNRVFTAEQMSQLLKISLNESHLFYKIGEQNTDSVFTRTFSLLIIPLAFELDSQTEFLTQEETIDIKNKVVQYLELEKDVRGYVVGKGWAHSTAHAADALDDIAKSRYMNHDELMEILHAIKSRVCIKNNTYINGEDDRMATAMMSVIKRNLIADNEIVKWIKSFGEIEKTGNYPEEHHLIMNTRNLLRSLYFQLLSQSSSNMFTEAILETLRKL